MLNDLKSQYIPHPSKTIPVTIILHKIPLNQTKSHYMILIVWLSHKNQDIQIVIYMMYTLNSEKNQESK